MYDNQKRLKIGRKAHILRHNKKNEFPSNLIFFDVESRLEKQGEKTIHIPYLVVACYYRIRAGKNTEEWQHFLDTSEFWTWACSKAKEGQKLVMFAHNVTYDIISSAGFAELKKNGFTIENFYEKGRTFILEYSHKEGKKTKSIVILNTGNFYEGTVKKLGDAFGIPKLEMDFENPTIEQALTYCKRDVEIIKTAMLTWFDFCKENDLGNFARTCPGQAFNAYRHRFMEHNIFIHDNEDAAHLERMAYYGGRSECWRIGEFKHKMYYLDVNSMYPFVMKNYPYPCKLISYRKNPSLGIVCEILDNNLLVCAKVKVKTNINVFPYRIENKIIFPLGEFTTYLCTPEIKYGLQHNLIVKVYEISVYESAYIFVKYVDFFYTKRLKAKVEGNRVNDLLYKLMMNSLYGKFGQKSGGWQIEGETDLEGSGSMKIFDADLNKMINIKWIDGIKFFETEEREGHNSFCAIAAHVTAYARMLLFEYIQIAKAENVYYMDTDSLFVTEEGYQKLLSAEVINKTELGMLKLEGETEHTIIHCPKDYVFGEKVRHKGIPKNAVQITPNSWQTTFWPKIATFIRENSLNQYWNIDRVKTLKRNYDKGTVMQDGIVKPIEIYEKDVIT